MKWFYRLEIFCELVVYIRIKTGLANYLQSLFEDHTDQYYDSEPGNLCNRAMQTSIQYVKLGDYKAMHEDANRATYRKVTAR